MSNVSRYFENIVIFSISDFKGHQAIESFYLVVNELMN